MYGNDTNMRQDMASQQAYAGEFAKREQRGAMLGGDTPRQPETMRFLNELEKNLSVCDALIDTLGARLQRVTRPAAETAGRGDPPAPREVAQTELGTGIQTMADRVSGLNMRLRVLADRLEV